MWQAYGGIRHLNGYPDRAPVRANISLGDSLAGLHGAFGAVMALLHRQRAGPGASGQASESGLHCRACAHQLMCPLFASLMQGSFALGLRACCARSGVLALLARASYAFAWRFMSVLMLILYRQTFFMVHMEHHVCASCINQLHTRECVGEFT